MERRGVMLVISLFILNFAYAQGEDYRPMLEDMKTWEYEYHHFDENEDDEYDEDGLKETVYTVRYTLSGDTVINGVGYHKMYRDVGGHLTYYAAYREEGKKVYERLPREEWDFIVADFEYEGLYDPEDPDDDLYSFFTDEIDYVKVDGQVYRRHTYTDCRMKAIGIEGIGYAYYGLEYPSVYAPQPTCICDYQVFTACYDKDGNVFRASDFTKIGIRDYYNILGDVNGDGVVTISDVAIMVDNILGQQTPGFIDAVADANNDGDISITDVSELIGSILEGNDLGRPSYVPFVEEGKTWYCGYDHDIEDIFPWKPEDPSAVGIDCIFTMCGDTLMNGKEYKKVYCQFEEYYGDKEQHYYCAVREVACRVFIMEEDATEEQLLYDFSRPGETITLNHDGIQFARSVGWHRYDFLPNQLVYTVCKFTEDGDVDYVNDSDSWADGVGDLLNNPFAIELRFFPFDEPKFGKEIMVRTCMKEGKYIFSDEWMAEPTK